VVKGLVTFNHAISGEMLSRMSKCDIALAQTKTAVALYTFQGLRQAIRIIVAEENRRALPEFAK
jgi:hypothetical protein